MTDTICAVATAPGWGGIGIIRVSGPDAFSILGPLLRGPAAAALAGGGDRGVHYGFVTGAGGEDLDEVLVTVMPAPRTYTREDVAEINCHGGPVPLRRVLERVLAAGARLAAPGEFTRRAFLNGRISLDQAEAVADLIAASSEAAARQALAQVEGRLARAVRDIEARTLDVLASLEAGLDFTDEGLALPGAEAAGAALDGLVADLDRLLAGAETGRRLREGVTVALCGRPNAGKSSLMNALLEEERVLVHPLPGTTRDVVEDHLVLSGMPVRLLDTAGLRTEAGPVEAAGIARARAAWASADRILLVADGAAPWTGEDADLLADLPPGRGLVVVNKADRPAAWDPAAVLGSGNPWLRVSALDGTGLDALRERLADLLGASGPSLEPAWISNARHAAALSAARLDRARDLWAEAELASLDLRQALTGLGRIRGSEVGEAALDEIFSRFCIGK